MSFSSINDFLIGTALAIAPQLSSKKAKAKIHRIVFSPSHKYPRPVRSEESRNEMYSE
jgi:hypothetical protein